MPDKSLRVTKTISRVGLGMANGRTNSFCSLLNCRVANSGERNTVTAFHHTHKCL